MISVFKKYARGMGLFAITSGYLCAGSVTWHIQNKYYYSVSLQFYTGDLRRVWPASDRVWVLNDSRIHTYRLRCNYGEKICYGAWPEGNDGSRYWGIGKFGEHSCTKCCTTCDGGETPIVILH